MSAYVTLADNKIYDYKLQLNKLSYDPGPNTVLGFVQLNSGSASYNTTLNLTGPILLGLGIAAATLFYANFNAFQV